MLDRLIRSHRPGFSLEQPFYTDPEVFALDVEKVWMRYWLYAGHISQLPQPGSWFVYRIATESVIVIRDEQGVVRALNVCTHRGSRIATQPCGQAKKLICPYHQWVFDCDGTLRTPKLMPEDFDPSGYNLRQLRCEVLEGLFS
jgi:Rieske 2Fe-2S family protein